MRRRSCAHLRPLGDRRFRLAYLLEPRDNIGAAVEQPLADVEVIGAVARGLPVFERPHVDADCLRRFARSEEVADDLIKSIGCCHCRSEEHTSELQSLMRISYAVFCLKKIQAPHTRWIALYQL